MLRVVLIDLAGPHVHIDFALQDLIELQSLVETYGGVDVVRIIQHRKNPDPSTFIGRGKVQELIEIVELERIDVVVINAMVKSTVLFNLTQKLWSVNPNIQVWDRVDLILNIFEKHAQTAEAKLQIEIARMKHMGPSIFGLGGTLLSRQGGGIGTRGLGETNIELMKRHFRSQIKKKEEELAKVSAHRQRQLQRRHDLGIKTVSLIGYTNSGKTSLFNRLTGKKNVVEDALFVTLDSAVGEVFLSDSQKKVILSDTIGFIQNLPSSLIETFKSTLMESMQADVLFHVIDVSDPRLNEKIEVVEHMIGELGLDSKPIVYVFNKVDAVPVDAKFLRHLETKFASFDPQFISVSANVGIDSLKELIRSLM